MAKVATASASEPLGNITSYSSLSGLQRRYALQDVARSVLVNERVCFCMRCNRSKTDGAVGVIYSAAAGRAAFDGVMACGSVWICPVCMAKISEERRIHLEKAYNVGTAAGFYFGLLTLTFSHGRTDDLLVILAAVAAAWGKFVSGAGWKALKRRYGILEYCRALETTHSWMNAWHPHHHVLLVFQAVLSAEMEDELRADFTNRWLACLALVGLTGDPDYAVDFTSRNDFIAGYIAKFGCEPKKDPVGAKSVSFEVAKQNSKLARSKGVKHRNYLQILADYGQDGLAMDADLIKEYAKAFKGRRQLMPSRGFWKLFGLESLENLSDEELAENSYEDKVLVVLLPVWMWRYVVRLGLRAALLEIVQFGDWAVVKRWFMETFGCLPPPVGVIRHKKMIGGRGVVRGGVQQIEVSYSTDPLVVDRSCQFVNSPVYLDYLSQQKEKLAKK